MLLAARLVRGRPTPGLPWARTPLALAATVIPIEDRHYLCPLCPSVLTGVEAAAHHAGTTHADAAALTYLDLDDPKHLPDDPGLPY